MKHPHGSRQQFLVRFGYDGARFCGLQPQGPTVPTAGLALKQRLTEAAGAPPKGLNFAARTDAGVHALKNIATCYWYEPLVASRVKHALMEARDDGLVDVQAFEVPMWVHARGCNRGKRYRYLIEDQSRTPTSKTAPTRHAWCVAPALDASRMRTAAAHLLGTQDFSSLRGGGCSAASPVKTIVSLRIGGPFATGVGCAARYVVEVAGDAFLRHMVRNLVALLVEVGAGLRDPDDVVSLLALKSRARLGVCAPGCGLVLAEVGCVWPDDGSFLLRELRALTPVKVG